MNNNDNIPELIQVLNKDADSLWKPKQQTSRVMASVQHDKDGKSESTDKVLARTSVLYDAYSGAVPPLQEMEARFHLAHEIGHLMGYSHPVANGVRGTLKAFFHAIKVRFGLMSWNSMFRWRSSPSRVWQYYEDVVEPVWKKQWQDGKVSVWKEES